MNQMITAERMRALQKDIPVLAAQIRALYMELDRQFGLHGAEVPITFGFETDLLGSYTQAGADEKEHFHFSLLFIGYAVELPLGKEDRMDLYKHEYAHYMQYHMAIPKQYTFQPGVHGSAWKYCCSLVGAVPTPYYKVGEALMKQDYDRVLRNPIHDRTVALRDNYRREQKYQNDRNSVVQYEAGDEVEHPKFGKGLIEKVEPCTGSVRLHIRFGEDVKVIDQKWLLRTRYRAKG